MTSKENSPVDFSEEFLRSYREYAFSVVEDRAIPDLRDGLKPVQRRILYAMIELLGGNNKMTSSVRIVGETNGKYHPKGNTAIYGALVKMTQTFNLTHSYIQGQGNFGSLDGDGPAADRYTLVKLSPLIREITRFQDIFPEGLNYDLTLPEPPLLPGLFPYSFTTGTSGIAVGIATNTVPFNLQEVLNVLIAIGEGEDDEETLLENILGPDFPTGGSLLDSREDILKTLKTGRGSFRVCADHEDIENGVIMTSVPYGTYKDPIIEDLSNFVEEKIPEIKEIYDESTKGKIRVRFVFRPNTDSQVTLNKLFKYSKFAVAVPYSNVFLIDKKAKSYGFIEAVKELFKYHQTVLFEEAKFKLANIRRVLKQQRVLNLTIENLKPIVDLFANVKDSATLKTLLNEAYGIEGPEVDYLLSLRLSQLTRFEKQKVEENIRKLMQEEEENIELIENPLRLVERQINEYFDISKRYSINRRTNLINIDYNKMNLIPFSRHIAVVSEQGFFRVFPIDNFRTQRRGGQGVNFSLDSSVSQVFEFTSHDMIYVFTNRNRIFYIPGQRLLYTLDERPHLREVLHQERLPLQADESVRHLVAINQTQISSHGGLENHSLLFVYTDGGVRRVYLDQFNTSRTRGIRAGSTSNEDVEINAVFLINNSVSNQWLSMLSSGGRLLTFPVDQIRVISRISQAVIGMRLKEGESVISSTLIHRSHESSGNLMVISADGYGRVLTLNSLVYTSRGGSGVLLTTQVEEEEVFPMGIVFVNPEVGETLLVWTSTGRAIQVNTEDIRVVTDRRGRGVILLRVEPSERVLGMSVFNL